MAFGVDWPGWSRGARSVELALEMLESYRVAGGAARPDDLAGGGDGLRSAVAPAERAEVGDPAGRCPGERVLWTGRRVAVAHDLTGVVHRLRKGVVASAEGADIDRPAGLGPGECVCTTLGRRTNADDLARVAYVLGVAVAAERAEVDNPALLRPGERMLFRIADGVTEADDLPGPAGRLRWAATRCERSPSLRGRRSTYLASPRAISCCCSPGMGIDRNRSRCTPRGSRQGV